MLGWGHCASDCPIVADGWRDDDATFIVKYRDVQTWKVTAFLTYIYVILSLLIVGLILTLMVTLCGKIKL